MPGFDGTGPFGRGAMTGWGNGNCNSANQSAFFGMGFCRGRGRGMRQGGGMGRGFRRGGFAGVQFDEETSIQALESQAGFLKSALDNITNKINSLKTS
jgi:phage-related tail fiber protein